ncbi:angiotensin-converting enzyme-like protein Ace3 [Perognathus longimembris pacificus]|uniref:angiotensin-converting enzyme-like protein Ace3 n=1 Tax=Perognathus longimembris pacificus TaxID=214514 RepID=UPI0020187533|nr:angiotensin-converting enzyme-like protein Ace3 [Perognathus longimembris pacificus]
MAHDWPIAFPSSAVLLVMGTRWTRPGPSLLVLLCYGQLLSWIGTADEANFDQFYSETEAKLFLQFYEQTAQVVFNQFMEASWNYVTNITKPNREEMLNKEVERSQFMLYFGTRARLFNINQFHDPVVKRMLSKLQDIDKAALPKDELLEYNKLLAYMETAYSMGQVCMSEGPCVTLESDLEEIMATSRNEKELLWAWQGWHDTVGRQLRPLFGRYVQLSNKAANLNGYDDMGDLWRAKYESDTLEDDLEDLFEELKPLYLNLHAYVRRSLFHHYGPDMIDLRGPIPAHLLGNMWAQSWVKILDLVLPYPKKPPEDITKNMKGQHWKPEKMFQEADTFFTSLGLISVPNEFWKKSMLEKPTDGREVECHTSAWNFHKDNDFRIKKCTEVTIEDLLSIFHQMGHIQYFLQYQNHSILFRAGANPAFEEAVGLVIALSASSHKYLLNRGLLSYQHQDPEEEINFMMGIALEKIAFIPFSYLVDVFRWRVFDGSIQEEFYNQEWWNLRLKLQGLCPPIPRSEEEFDPGAKFHIPANVPYIRYFLSLVLQFQFHEALCKASGHSGPLHRCNIFNSKVAGNILGNVLKLGSSKPWPLVLKKLTGKSKVSAEPLMTYFKPLLNWLVNENVQKGEVLGWPDFTCTFEGRNKNKVNFLTAKLDPDQAYFWQWLLFALCCLLFLLFLGLAIRLYSLEKGSPTQDSKKQAKQSYFLGRAMDTNRVVRRQWILLGLCIILVICSISLILWIVTRKHSMFLWDLD